MRIGFTFWNSFIKSKFHRLTGWWLPPPDLLPPIAATSQPATHLATQFHFISRSALPMRVISIWHWWCLFISVKMENIQNICVGIPYVHWKKSRSRFTLPKVDMWVYSSDCGLKIKLLISYHASSTIYIYFIYFTNFLSVSCFCWFIMPVLRLTRVYFEVGRDIDGSVTVTMMGILYPVSRESQSQDPGTLGFDFIFCALGAATSLTFIWNRHAWDWLAAKNQVWSRG